MQYLAQEIPDVFVIEPTVHGDHRGYFVETYHQDKLEEALGYKVDFVQDNESMSCRGVLRGLHFQLAPYAQSKLVRVTEGAVLDVVVDIREGSPTFGKHVAVELSRANKKQLFIPRGFAHGFVVLTDTALVAYKADNYYSPEFERGFAFNDDELSIDWRVDTASILLSEKDSKQPLLADLKEYFDYAQNYYD